MVLARESRPSTVYFVDSLMRFISLCRAKSSNYRICCSNIAAWRVCVCVWMPLIQPFVVFQIRSCPTLRLSCGIGPLHLKSAGKPERIMTAIAAHQPEAACDNRDGSASARLKGAKGKGKHLIKGKTCNEWFWYQQEQE